MQVLKQGQAAFSDITEALLSVAGKRVDLGSALWWQALRLKGAPLILNRDSDKQDVIFIWQYAAQNLGLKTDVAEVYIDINGITDHHSFNMVRLTRYDKSDVCFFHCQISAQWRGGYSFFPVSLDLVQPDFQGDLAQRRQLNRNWFLKIRPLARKDPLNKHNLGGCLWGLTRSPLHLDKALSQTNWAEFDAAQGQARSVKLTDFSWKIPGTNLQRDAWTFSTVSAHSDKKVPLVIILDGSFWTHSLPIFSALESATFKAQIPPAVYLFIDEINGQYRFDDMGCNSEFWLALQNNLLPQVEKQFALSKDPKQRVVTGQSLGGLAAMYAGLNWPNNFASILSQSGSFWWPDNTLLKTASEYQSSDLNQPLGELSRLVADGLGEHTQLNIFMEVGSQEDIMIDLNKDLYRQLEKQEHRLAFRLYEGGHERLCWRGGLIDGLAFLLA